MEKIIEIIDLILTLILIGSLITDIPAVNKLLTKAEVSIDQGFGFFLKTTHEKSIIWISNIFKKLFFVSLIFMILVFYIAPQFLNTIDRGIYLFLIFMMAAFGYFWMALTIARPTKETLIDIVKSSWYLLAAPFIFGFSDLVLGTDIFRIMDAQIASSVDFFNLSIFSNRIANTFILFTIFWYSVITLGVLGMWALSLPAYFSLWIILHIIYRYATFFKASKEKDRILLLIVFLFIVNKLIYIFLF